MKNKIGILLFLLCFPLFVSAYTREDIIELVSNQKLCDSETNSVYEKYLELYTLVIENKDMSEADLNNIYIMLKNNLDYLKEKDVCSFDDLSSIPKEKKAEIKEELYNGVKVIAKSPNKANSNANIKYNGDDTIEIYENGYLIDKIDNNYSNFNYVGVPIYIIYFKYIIYIFLFIEIILLIVFRKKEIFANILNVILPINVLLCVSYTFFGNYIYSIYNVVKTMSVPEDNGIVEIVVEDGVIKNNPNYGVNYATLKIENLSIDVPVYYGDSKKILSKGLGHKTDSKLPGSGKTIIYSGHNSKGLLNNLKDIITDEIIEVKTSYGEFEYQVFDIEILKENEFLKLKKSDKEMLILYTCYPFDELVYSKERFVVYANLVEKKWLYE